MAGQFRGREAGAKPQSVEMPGTERRGLGYYVGGGAESQGEPGVRGKDGSARSSRPDVPQTGRMGVNREIRRGDRAGPRPKSALPSTAGSSKVLHPDECPENRDPGTGRASCGELQRLRRSWEFPGSRCLRNERRMGFFWRAFS